MKLCAVVTLFTKFQDFYFDISMVTKWARGLLHSKGEIRVFLLQEVSFALVVHSVGVSKYAHDTVQPQESLLDYGATKNKTFFILGR